MHTRRKFLRNMTLGSVGALVLAVLPRLAHTAPFLPSTAKPVDYRIGCDITGSTFTATATLEYDDGVLVVVDELQRPINSDTTWYDLSRDMGKMERELCAMYELEDTNLHLAVERSMKYHSRTQRPHG